MYYTVTKNKMYEKKYIYDVLYGAIYLPEYAWHVIFTPEVQRLRELRLCNINSLCLTGGANINRFEHTLGTCHLALTNLDNGKYDISPHEKMLFVLATIFHDVYNAAFGHSLEYVEGVKPESMFYDAATGRKHEAYQYRAASFEPIYFGRLEELFNKIKELKLREEDIKEIGDIINGKGKLGKLLSGTMDLDNIDNVCRLAYHMGIFNNKELPLKLAKAIWIENNELRIDEENIPLIKEWINLRESFYKFLLLNPEEFSAKYMLTEAFELFQRQEDKEIGFAWYDADFQLLDKLSKTSSDVSNIVSNLMCGQLYGCIAIYTTIKTEKYRDFLNIKEREIVEKSISSLIKPEVVQTVYLSDKEQAIIRGIKGLTYFAEEKKLRLSFDIKDKIFNLLVDNELSSHKAMLTSMRDEAIVKYNKYKMKSPIIGVHPILDINKTNRKVDIKTSNNKSYELGYSSRDLHLAILLKNKEYINLDAFEGNGSLKPENIENIKQTVKEYLINFLDDTQIIEHKLYSEITYGQTSN